MVNNYRNLPKEAILLKAVEDISSTKKRLKIEIPTEAIEKQIKDSLEKVRQKARIPGFRPGKTPMNIIEKYYGKNAESEAIEKIIPEFYDKALKEAALVPVAQPALEGGIDFKRNSPLSLAFTLEVRPKIEKLNYANLKVKDVQVSVSDEEIEAALKRLQEGKATYEVAEKEIENGDLITVDYEITHEEKTSTSKDQALQVGTTLLPKEISESLIGKKAGDTVEVEAPFPDNFHVKALAGKKAKVKNTVKAVKKKNLPPIDDELAKDVGFENLEGLRTGAKEEIEKAKKNEVQKIQKDGILEELIKVHEFDVPESMLERELSIMIKEVKGAGKSDKDEETLRTELKPEAIKTGKAEVILSIIGEKEGVTVTDEELKEKIMDISQRLNMPPETLMKIYVQKDGSLDGLRNSLYGQKVMDLLLSRATVEKGE
ncbi:MAG: trigger factor [Nitrospirae bacterium]|nr:MAG: trigger factor [Nitrospirota bacterium]